jgi:outer membrane protein assembly factor BamA
MGTLPADIGWTDISTRQQSLVDRGVPMSRKIASFVFFASLLSVYSHSQEGTAAASGWTDKNNTEQYAAYMIRLAYSEQGYFGVRVDIKPAGTKRVFAVEPGPVYHVREIKVSGLKAFPVEEVMAGAPKPGDVYSPARTNEWIKAIEKKYAAEGGPLKVVNWGGRLDHARAQATIEVTFEERTPTASPRDPHS